MLCLVVPALIAAFYKIQRIRTRPSHHKDDREIANALYTIVSVAAVISYFLFIGCFIATRRNTYVALITPSESLDANNNDLDKKNVCCLCFAFTVITTLFLCSVAVFYAIIWKSQPRNSLSTHSRLEWVRSFSPNGQQLQLAMCLPSARLRFVSHTLKRLLPERPTFSENETPKFDKILSAVKKNVVWYSFFNERYYCYIHFGISFYSCLRFYLLRRVSLRRRIEDTSAVFSLHVLFEHDSHRGLF